MSKPSDVTCVRHLEDVEDLRQPDRDSPINPSEQIHIPNIAKHILNQLPDERDVVIRIVSSPRERVLTTIGLVVDNLTEERDDIDVTLFEDARLTGLHHGKFCLPDGYMPGDEFVPDKLAWEIWVDETFNKKNLTYRYGDPIFVEGLPMYPQLVGHFEEYGESQLDFSLRVYSFLIDFATEVMEADDHERHIVSSHLAVILRMAEILAVTGTLDNQFLKTIPLGTLAFEEWDHMSDLPPGTMSKLTNPIYTIEIDIRKLIPYIPMLEVERDYLLALKMQTES